MAVAADCSASLIYLVVCSDPENLLETTTTLNAAMETEVGDHRLEPGVQEVWFSCWCDCVLSRNKNEHVSKHHLGPRTLTSLD